MRSLGLPLLVAACLVAGSAHADIPTTDAAVLTEKAQTSSTTIKLIPIKTQRRDADQGVNCAVTTGKKANVTDPTVQPQPDAGARTIQPYAPDMPASPATTAQGGTLSSQTHFKSTADVVAGVDASRSTIGAAAQGFRSAGQQVGTAPTVMGALDMNSGARVANNLAWNGAIGSANLWVTALNALSLVRANDASRAATGMATSTVSVPPRFGMPTCPVGSLGSGTVADPCRAASGACAASAASNGVCTPTQFVDQDGQVAIVLLPSGSARTADGGGQPLSLAEVIAVLASQSAPAP